MKVLAIVALCLAAALSADASTCTTVCSGLCDVSKKACDIAVVLGPVCDITNGVCAQSCAAGCACIDKCDTECTPGLEQCKTDGAGNPIAIAQCSINFQACTGICGNKCAADTTASIVSSIGK